MTPLLLNEAFLAKITIIKVFSFRGEHVRTYTRLNKQFRLLNIIIEGLRGKVDDSTIH